jgi:hypothetical protein
MIMKVVDTFEKLFEVLFKHSPYELGIQGYTWFQPGADRPYLAQSSSQVTIILQEVETHNYKPWYSRRYHQRRYGTSILELIGDNVYDGLSYRCVHDPEKVKLFLALLSPAFNAMEERQIKEAQYQELSIKASRRRELHQRRVLDLQVFGTSPISEAEIEALDKGL